MYIAKDGYSYNEGCPLLKLGGKTPAIRLGLTACTTRHRSPRRSWVVEEVSLGRKRGASHHSPIGAHLGRRAQLGRMGRKWGAWGEIGARGANGAHGRHWGAPEVIPAFFMDIVMRLAADSLPAVVPSGGGVSAWGAFLATLDCRKRGFRVSAWPRTCTPPVPFFIRNVRDVPPRGCPIFSYIHLVDINL